MLRSDITAVVLSVGEPYTGRALESVERQSPPVSDVVVIRGTIPFHRAVNEGAARVRTPYFVQVDADMVLDPTCCADLRACVEDGVGVVIGQLRDSLIGRVAGIKLFRTACFEHERFPDSISPDTDFGNAIARRGWTTIYAIGYPPTRAEPLHVFGDHQPEYTPVYTFQKFAMMGARHRYRRAAASLRQLVCSVRASRHEVAVFALIGTACGITRPAVNDLLVPESPSAEFECLQRFLDGGYADTQPPPEIRTLVQLDVREAWQLGYRCGAELYRRRAADTFIAALNHLADGVDGDRGPVAWVGLVGLCHGLFADGLDESAAEGAFALLNQVLPYPYRLALQSPAI